MFVKEYVYIALGNIAAISQQEKPSMSSPGVWSCGVEWRGVERSGLGCGGVGCGDRTWILVKVTHRPGDH